MAQRIDEVLVKDYMTTKMVTIDQNRNMLDVARRMIERNISSLAITDEKERIVGIVTERDIVNAVTNQLVSNKATASRLMTRPVLSISKDSSIEDAARMMALNKIRHLIVLDPLNSQVVGIITVTDLARYLRQNMVNEEAVASEVWELFF